MNRHGKIILLALIALYLLVRGFRESAFPLPGFFHDHFSDLLYLPVMLLVCLWLTRRLKRDPQWLVPLSYVLVLVAFNSFLFEYYLPQMKSGFTSDPIDCLMYAGGGLAFLLIQKRLL